MNRTITVRGTGKATAAPDLVVITMVLWAKNLDYGRAMSEAEKNIERLTQALEKAGFDRKGVKTTNFDISTKYDYRREKDGSSKSVFDGYVLRHDIKLEFDFDSERLGKAIDAISSSRVQPELSIKFTVKDANALKEEVLRSAAANARGKAEVLCSASGCKLGQLISIDYNWGEVSIYSNTRYEVGDRCYEGFGSSGGFDIEPEDVSLSDTAAFVWEIV